MGWLSILFAGIASYLLYSTGHSVLFVLSIVVTIGSFWSWGIMHNFATWAASGRSTYRGAFFDINEDEAAGVPDWIAMVNMAFSVTSLILLVTAVVIVWK